MNSRQMNFFKGDNTGLFTTAKEIFTYLQFQGVTFPVDKSGFHHPGTLFNEYLRTILSTPSLKKAFNLSNSDCLQIDEGRSSGNSKAIKLLLVKGFISNSSIKDGKLDVYTTKAADLLCKHFLNDTSYVVKNITIGEFCWEIIATPKLFDFSGTRPRNSLLTNTGQQLDPFKKISVISLLSEEERAAVRKYEHLVKITRQQGRKPKCKRKKVK